MAKQQNVQTLTNADLDKIRLVIREEIKPIEKKTNELDLTVNGTNGLVSSVKTFLTRREAYIAIFIATSVVTLITNINSCRMDQNQTDRQQQMQGK